MIGDILDFYTIHPYIFLITIAIVSLFVGSFLNVVIHRLPIMLQRNFQEECRKCFGLEAEDVEKKLNLAFPSSHCPECKSPILPWHNIPLLSYIILRGRCASCHTLIRLRYPLVEILTLLLSIIVILQFGVSVESLAALLFTWIGICLTFIDIEYHILPDQLTLLLLWLGLILSLTNLFCIPQDAIIGATCGYLTFAIVQWTFFLITHKTGMGQGDYKYLAAMGAFLGWQMLPLIVLFASITGIIITIIVMISKRQKKSLPLPFGPYLAFAGWLVMLWGNDLIHYYLMRATFAA